MNRIDNFNQGYDYSFLVIILKYSIHIAYYNITIKIDMQSKIQRFRVFWLFQQSRNNMIKNFFYIYVKIYVKTCFFYGKLR